MSYYFLDSSALVKRCIIETGSSWIRQLTSSEHRIFVSTITQAEIISAVARRIREGTVTTRTGHAIRHSLSRHTRNEYNVIQFSSSINEKTLDLLEKYVLRASDALQLAAAVELQNRLTSAQLPPLTFLSSDQRLLTAALGEGLAMDNPNHYPK